MIYRPRGTGRMAAAAGSRSTRGYSTTMHTRVRRTVIRRVRGKKNILTKNKLNHRIPWIVCAYVTYARRRRSREVGTTVDSDVPGETLREEFTPVSSRVHIYIYIRRAYMRRVYIILLVCGR